MTGVDEYLGKTPESVAKENQTVTIKASVYDQIVNTLKVYGADETWVKADDHMFHRMITKDDVTTTAGPGFYSAGKMARATLKKLGIKI